MERILEELYEERSHLKTLTQTKKVKDRLKRCLKAIADVEGLINENDS